MATLTSQNTISNYLLFYLYEIVFDLLIYKHEQGIPLFTLGLKWIEFYRNEILINLLW